MKKQNFQPISNVLQEVLQDNRFSQKLNETKLLDSWQKVVGQTVADYTQNLYVKNNKLYVKLSSPALKSNLMLQIQLLTDKLNQAVGCHVIETIILL